MRVQVPPRSPSFYRNRTFKIAGRLAQRLEHRIYIPEVRGPNPLAPTLPEAEVAKVVKAHL